MSAIVAVASQGEGRCAVTGYLTMEAAPALWQQLKAGGLLGGAREADLSAVTDADSAGLALLIAWRGICLAGGGSLVFNSVPTRILALARLTSAEAALGG